MKQTTVNEFKDGLNLDLHPLVTPKTVLTDNINGTFITYNGNEFCLQNDRGNEYVASLTPGYTPIGIKEHNGILYIVSVNGTGTEIGTFPSPDYPDLYSQYNYNKETVYDLNLNKYEALHVLEDRFPLTGINLGYTTKTPVTIEIQDSYDGSVNLILVADGCKPRIINSGFSVLPDNKYKFINRNQDVATNVYDDIYKESELIRTSDVLTNVDLLGVKQGGQFKGGNYTFYIKFGDADFNQTDVVAESGIVSIFNGNNAIPSTISGTLLDERTDKMIGLAITGLNPIYSKIYIYYSREYSDTQGLRMTEYGMFKEPIDLDKEGVYGAYIQTTDPATNKPIYTRTGIIGQEIWLTGFEQTVPIDPEILNIDYHTIDWARAETQHSNMLFLGNVGQKETFELYRELDEITKHVTVSVSQTSLPAVSTFYDEGTEYYDVHNIYNKVGYYPGEIYRFGIVYILKDGSKTPVFNMVGKNFQTGSDISDGVFLMPNVDVIYEDVVKPIYLNFTLPEITNDNVLGWFVVRQKRIPNTICEGLNIAIDRTSNVPVIWDGHGWITQSFLDAERGELLKSHYEDDTSLWQKNRDVQLKYHNFNLSRTVVNEEQFQNWLNENGFVYVNNYWVSVVITNETYSINGTIPDSGTLKSKLEYVTRNMAEQYKSIHEEAANWNYTKVFTTFTETQQQQQAVQQLLNNLSNGARYRIGWFRQYTYDGTNEFNTPIDIPTDNYAVTLFAEGYPIDYELNTVTSNTSYNSTLRNNWKNAYSLDNGSVETMSRKTLREWACIDYWKEANALLSLDPCVNQGIASILDGSKFEVNLEREVTVDGNQEILYRQKISNTDTSFNLSDTKCVFVPSNTGAKVVDGYEFSNVAGNGTAVDKYKYFTFPDGVFEPHPEHHDGRSEHFDKLKEEINNPDVSTLTSTQEEWLYELYRTNLNINLIRGLFAPYIGLANKDRIPNGIYSIKHKSYLDNNDFIVRKQDQSEYYAVSKYLSLDQRQVDVFRGDCFTNTVTMRIIRSFIDNTAPVSDVVVDPDGWAKWVINKDINSVKLDAAWDDKTGPVRYDQVNVADVNTVDLGLWVTFKCLSSYNLGLRSLNPFHVDEMSLMGSPRTFHPLNTVSTSTGYKMEESFLLNDGLSATVGRKRYNSMPNIPYSKSEFANRIMFSNVHITDAFTNGYRTFQGLAYKDYDKQYGAITKLIPFGQNIFVVMEHGLGLISVNPKALLQTTTGEAIHIYGYGVLPDEITIISQDYGSKYEHSVIRTPIGIYGMDVDAKKIWRFSDKQGFETISDMKIETYLNDYLKQVPVEIGIEDVRAHYNGKKGDVMFAFYDKSDSIKSVGITNYFNVPRRKLELVVDQTKTLMCGTNLDDSDIELTSSDNLECSYSNKTLRIKGLNEGEGSIVINGINIDVTVTAKYEVSIVDSSEIEIEYDPDISWYTPSSSENKNIYFDIRKIDTFYGMRFSLPVFLKCPNGRPTSSNFSAVYAIDKTGVLSVESENKSIIDVPKDNHVADNRLYNQYDGYTWPTIVHVSEKCFKNTGTVGIRIYNKDKTEYDTCIVNVLNTNPEGVSYSQFAQKNLLWPFNIYVNTNSCFDVWYHHHLRHNQIINIDDPTAIWPIENGYSLQDGVRTNGTNIKLLYCSKQFKAGNKPGTYHITFTCPKTQYYDYSGTYTVTVHVLDPNGPASSEIPSSSIGQIEIQPKELDLYVGQKSNIKVVDKDSGSVINNVTWSTSQSAPFTKYGNTVTAIREGTGYLIATAKNGMVNDKATIRCTYDVGQSIRIPSKNIEMPSYSEEPMDVTIVCEHCTIEQVSSSLVTWTSSNSSIAQVMWKNKKPTICSYGAGQVTLTGKYLGQDDVSITCTVTVVEDEPEEPITYDAREREKDGKEPGGPLVYMQLGSTRRFKLTGQWWLSENDYYTRWTIYDQSEDNVISFESDPGEWNLVAMVSANKLGTAKIKMEYVERSTSNVEATYEWMVEVLEQVIYSTSVKINPSSITLLRGEKYKMKATVFPSNSTYKGVEWWTPQRAVVTVDQNGEIEAVGVGSGRLIATSLDDKSEDYITTTVIDPTITGGAEGFDFEDWNWIE